MTKTLSEMKEENSDLACKDFRCICCGRQAVFVSEVHDKPFPLCFKHAQDLGLEKSCKCGNKCYESEPNKTKTEKEN